MRYVPNFPLVHSNPVSVCTDGRWGIFEYSRWPQEYHDEIAHHMCIPNRPVQQRMHPYYKKSRVTEPSVMLFFPLARADWTETPQCGVTGLGLVKSEFIQPLGEEALRVCQTVEALRIPEKAQRLLRQLKVTMRQLFQRLQAVPTTYQHALVAFAHLQRLTLEVFGLMLYYVAYNPRFISGRDYTFEVLPVRGVFTSRLDLAGLLLRHGISVWIVHRITPQIRANESCILTTLDFSGLDTEPIFPRITSNEVDLRIRTSTVFDSSTLSRGLSLLMMTLSCANHFPTMPHVDPTPVRTSSSSSHPAKRARTEPSKPLEGTSTLVSNNSKKSKKRGGRPKSGKAVPQKLGHPQQHKYEKELSWPEVPLVWTKQLDKVSPLPAPPDNLAAVYYWPPSFILESEESKLDRHRYIHNYLRIRPFLKTRLLSPGIGGKPLRIREWKQALWGNYDPNDLENVSTNPEITQNKKAALRSFLAQGGSILSYSDTSTPQFRNSEVNLRAIDHDTTIMKIAMWEMREVNFRCELRALDALILKLDQQDEFTQRSRLEDLSRVWGATNGGDGVVPAWERTPLSQALFYWSPPGRVGWENRRVPFYNFVRFLSRWPDFPQVLLAEMSLIAECKDMWKVVVWEEKAVEFYVVTFIKYFHRLPISPSVCPLFEADVVKL